MKKRLLALVMAVLMLPFVAITPTAAETTEKVVVNFSASDGTTSRLLYGKQFYVDWKAGDGLPNDNATGKGADLSGSGANGAHKKMVFKTTLTFTDKQGDIDLQNCFKQIAIRLRSGRVDGNEQASNFFFFNPQNLTLTDGKADIAIPLTEFVSGNINWADVRQLIVMCEVADAYTLAGDGDSTQLSMTLENTRIVREFIEGEVDTSELEDLIKVTIKEEDFTPESVAAYNAAVQAGKDLMGENMAYSQEDIDAACAAIKEAKKNLVSSAVVYKGTLQALVDEELSREPSTAYTNAKAAAEEVLVDETATQKDVNKAVMALAQPRLALVSQPAPGNRYDTVAEFSAANQSWSYLQGGKQVYTDWKKLDDNAFVDATGSANNGTDPNLYLQMQVAFTNLASDVDPSTCWKQIGMRLRSSAVDGQLKEADFFYIQPYQATYNEEGYWTVRVPLRSIATANINWADVRELNVIVEMNESVYVTDDLGNAIAGDSTKIGVSLAGVSLVRKDVWTVGDVDNQGGVTAADALLVLQLATKKVDNLIPLAMEAADADFDGSVTASDALLILQCATKKITTLEKEEEKLVAFTFDDGPGAYTAELLDGLKERGVSATFFVQGNHVEQYPELVTRMAEEGHEVGNHTYSHQDMRSLSDEQVVQEIQKCSDLIEQYTGKAPTLLRGPGFVVDERGTAYLKANNMRQINCSKSVRDHDQPDKQVIFDLFMKGGECIIEDGDIVLLHEVNQPSAQVALELIDIMLEKGYRLVTVQELLDIRANGGIPGVKYERVVSLD